MKYLCVEKVQFAIQCIVKQASWIKWHAFLTQQFCSSPSSFVPPYKINMPVEKKAAIFLFRLWVEIWGDTDARRLALDARRLELSLKSKRREYFIAYWTYYCCFLLTQFQACVFVYQYTGHWCDVNITWWCISSLDVLRDVHCILFTWL